MERNALVQCNICEQTRQVNFEHCLSYGWPKCCGETMKLQAHGVSRPCATGPATTPAGRGVDPGE